MWQVLKTEIAYNKFVLIAAYVVILFVFVAGFIWDCCRGVHNIVPNTIVPFYIAFGFMTHTSCKESRDRQHCMLPQSQAQYGLTRMLFFILFEAGVLLLWLITYFMNIAQAPQAIWMILTANALMLTLRAFGFIFRDTKAHIPPITTAEGWTRESIVQRLTRDVITTVLVLLLIVAAANSSDSPGAVIQMNMSWPPIIALREFLRGPWGALAANALFVLAFYWSIAVSLPRREFAAS